MPRGPRLDAPGALHHVRARGIEKRPIFESSLDREDFLGRIARLVGAGAWTVYAWALMPNHVHLLVRTGSRPLSHSMRSLLGGYATRFNVRHERVGHLFQNRYKSTLVQDESYFLALVRYVHRNPIPTVVPDTAALERYPYTGHSAILGRVPREWQDSAAVLGRFGADVGSARSRYARFIEIAEPIDLPEEGLVRKGHRWAAVGKLRRGRERFTTDERVLGSARSVRALLAELEATPTAVVSLSTVVERVCESLDLPVEAVSGRGRTAVVSAAREGIAYLWIRYLGQSGRLLAQHLGLACSSIYASALRGSVEPRRWIAIFQGNSTTTGMNVKRPRQSSPA